MNQKIKIIEEEFINSRADVLKDFQVGDIITVGLIISDNDTCNGRVQDFTGVCIAKRNKGIGSNIIVIKETDGIEIRRNILIYSPLVSYIKVIQKGFVRRAKLYYLLGKKGKAARVKRSKKK